ncbi:MAG: hypothetical protein ACRCZH_01020 [Cetobacterium sp.]
MPRIKCPACGSRNTARLQYGMPMWDEELQRKLDNKTVMLGGCCISPESPDYHCNSCHQKFRDTPYMEDLKYFVFTRSGFGGHYSCFFLDCEKKILRYIITDGFRVDIRKKNIPKIYENEGRYREIHLDDKKLNSLLKSLAKCKINYWKKNYVDESIIDGFQWEIEMKFEGRRAFKSWGDNLLSPYLEELEKLVFSKLGISPVF